MFHKYVDTIMSLGWIERTTSFDNLHLQYKYSWFLEKLNTTLHVHKVHIPKLWSSFET